MNPAPLTAPNQPADVLEHIVPGTQIIVPLGNGEATAVMEQLDAAAAAGDPRIDEVRVHQMHAIHDRPYLHGAYGTRLKHISYFLSPVTRPYFAKGTR